MVNSTVATVSKIQPTQSSEPPRVTLVNSTVATSNCQNELTSGPRPTCNGKPTNCWSSLAPYIYIYIYIHTYLYMYVNVPILRNRFPILSLEPLTLRFSRPPLKRIRVPRKCEKIPVKREIGRKKEPWRLLHYPKPKPSPSSRRRTEFRFQTPRNLSSSMSISPRYHPPSSIFIC